MAEKLTTSCLRTPPPILTNVFSIQRNAKKCLISKETANHAIPISTTFWLTINLANTVTVTVLDAKNPLLPLLILNASLVHPDFSFNKENALNAPLVAKPALQLDVRSVMKDTN